MQTKSITREIALLILGQLSEKEENIAMQFSSMESLMNQALNSLVQHWRENLDECAKNLSMAHQELVDSELKENDKESIATVRDHLKRTCLKAESVLNGLSSSLDLPRLVVLSDYKLIRDESIKRVHLVLNQIKDIDTMLDSSMEGWRLHRLPRIDRDILRLAVIDLIDFKVPPAIACNEAVELANCYSDEQGRKMINGILRRLQNNHSIKLSS